MIHRLFSYGTLRDLEIQQILFEHECPMEPARLNGWSLYCTDDDDGYLFIKPSESGQVSGQVIDFDDDDLHIADLWEEVPRYARERVTVALMSGDDVQVWVYTRADAHGRPVATSGIAFRARERVLDEVRAFRAEIDDAKADLGD